MVGAEVSDSHHTQTVSDCVAVEWLGRTTIAVKTRTRSKMKKRRVCIFQYSWQEALMISAAIVSKRKSEINRPHVMTKIFWFTCSSSSLHRIDPQSVKIVRNSKERTD